MDVTSPPAPAASVRHRFTSSGFWVQVALWAQTAISAGTYIVAKRAMSEVDPITLVICRYLIAGVLFAVILLLTPGPAIPPRRALVPLLYLGLLAGPLNQGLFFFGLERSTTAHSALLYALTPAVVYLIALGRRQERLSRDRVAGMALAMAGALVLLLSRGLQEAKGPLIGDLFISGAVVAWALYTADGKGFIADHGPIRATAWSMIAALLLILPATPIAFHWQKVASAHAGTLIDIVYLAVLTSVLSYLLWYYALSKVEASKAAVFSNLQPIATAIAAWILLGEQLTWEVGVSGALVLLGVRLTQRA